MNSTKTAGSRFSGLLATLILGAAQVLPASWCRGADLASPYPVESEERFLTAGNRGPVAALELKAEATVAGPEVRLKQIIRWSDADAAALQQAGDLIIARFDANRTTISLDLDQLKTTLEDAGINLAAIHFSGATVCRLRLTDQRLVNAAEQAIAAAILQHSSGPSVIPTLNQLQPAPGLAASATQPGTIRSLGQILTAELATRLNVPVADLQITFSGPDQKLADLAEPQFRFEVEPRRSRALGRVTWDVTIGTDTGQQKVAISADVRLWHTQLLTTRALAFKQVIRPEDVEERRMLVDRVPSDPPLSPDQVVGQQAGRDMGPGTALTPRLVLPVQLVRSGELITVTVQHGAIQVKWVAEAREPGSYGQVIRVRKPQSREEFHVTLTGPQQAVLSAMPSLDPARSNVALVP